MSQEGKVKKRSVPKTKGTQQQSQSTAANSALEPLNNQHPQTEHKKGSLRERLKHHVGHHLQAPQFMKDNAFIHSGYRINFTSMKSAAKSLFMVHNELVNIWSHFLGAILVVILSISLCTSFANLDIVSWKQKLMENVSDKINPLYNELLAFDEALNQKVKQGVEIIRQDYHILEENFLNNFNTLFTEMKNEITPHNVEEIVEKWRQFSFQDYYHQLDLTTINTFKSKLMSGLNDMKNDLVRQIDSHEFDWIDFHMTDFLHDKDVDTTTSISPTLTHDVSRWPIFVFLISAFLCLSCSTAFHIFYVVNPKYNKIFLRLDYAGVVLLISGSTFPVIQYGFFCQPHLAIFYFSLVGLASVVVFIVTLQDFIDEPKNFMLRSYLFSALSIFAAVPLIHLAYYDIFDSAAIGNYSMINSIFYYILMSLCYLGGLIIFATRCPERYKPGKFDICGSSHQLWHISILLAILFTYIGSIINFYIRKMNSCPITAQ